ncbi:MAG: zf-HC2 domain-containing protein [Desulfobacterales bacterium]
MKCTHIQRHLSAYIDDCLTPSMKREVEAHLSVCPACRQELDVLSSLTGELKHTPEVAAPEDFVFSLHRRLTRTSGLKRLRTLVPPFRRKMQFGFVTATIMAGCILFVIHMQQPELARRQRTGFQIEPEQRYDRVAEEKAKAPPAQLGESRLPEGFPSLEENQKQRSNAREKKSEYPIKSDMSHHLPVSEPMIMEGETPVEWELRLDAPLCPSRDYVSPKLPDTADRLEDKTGGGASPALHERSEDLENAFGRTDAEQPRITIQDAAKHVETITSDMGGSVASIEKAGAAEHGLTMAIVIPGSLVDQFMTELAQIGRFDRNVQGFSESSEKVVTILLTLTAE